MEAMLFVWGILCPLSKTCGTILGVSKNTSRFPSRYATKLCGDQLREQADHAILPTTVSLQVPANWAVMNNVILADPARVVVVAHLLRRHIVQMHVLRIGNDARQEKAEALCQHIVSPAWYRRIGSSRRPDEMKVFIPLGRSRNPKPMTWVSHPIASKSPLPDRSCSRNSQPSLR
jgi:hypothetical protein